MQDEHELIQQVYAAKEDNAGLYARSRQQKNLGKLFIHYNDWGIDVCLTDSGDYYLSYLIKIFISDFAVCF